MEWIKTKDKLPDIPEGQMKAVMGFDGYRQVLVNFYNDEGTRFRVDCLKCFNEVTDRITHWKYLDDDPEI